MTDTTCQPAFLIRHVGILRASFQHWTGKSLLDENLDSASAVTALAEAPFAVVSHGTETEPIFNYANKLALQLFEMSWEEFTALPSRLSAEAPNQAERARLLQAVTRQGYIDDYSGIRIAKSGKRFMIREATIWNLLTETGQHYGQAALIRHWERL
jgi:hypothetical protein